MNKTVKHNARVLLEELYKENRDMKKKDKRVLMGKSMEEKDKQTQTGKLQKMQKHKKTN